MQLCLLQSLQFYSECVVLSTVIIIVGQCLWASQDLSVNAGSQPVAHYKNKCKPLLFV